MLKKRQMTIIAFDDDQQHLVKSDKGLPKMQRKLLSLVLASFDDCLKIFFIADAIEIRSMRKLRLRPVCK